MPNAYGSTAAATAMNTAAMPIMLWKNATSSGIAVICTVFARQAPYAPPTTRPSTTQPRPAAADRWYDSNSLTSSAAVVSAAIAMPVMPKTLPRIDVVGWLSPFSAWMKQMLATRYSSVTRLRLTSCLRPARRSPSACPSS